MAVEARHLNLFPPQLIQDRCVFIRFAIFYFFFFNHSDRISEFVISITICRELMNSFSQENGAAAAYTAQQMRFLGIPSAAALPESQFYHPAAVCEAKTSVNTDSGLTYNISAPRKRSRDDFSQFHPVQNFAAAPPQKSDSLSHGGDLLPQIQQYQFEIDTIISQHVSI